MENDLRRWMRLTDFATNLPVQETLLYRGDATKIAQFDVTKTDDRALFGRGIYLTDDPNVAGDYTLKGSSQVVFSDREATSQRELIASYLRQLIDKAIDWKVVKNKLTQDWAVKQQGLSPRHKRGDRLPGLSDDLYESLAAFLAAKHKALANKAFSQVKAELAELIPTFRIARNTMGEMSIVSRARTGSIASFDVPESYLKRVLHTERPLSDKVLKVIRGLWIEVMGPHDHQMRDNDENEVNFDSYVKSYKKQGTRYAWTENQIGGKGQNPTLDELLNGTHGGSDIFKDNPYAPAARKFDRFVQAMQSLGYVGLQYDGGIRAGGYTRGGGGRAHVAYVFWDAAELATFRKTDTAPDNDFEHEPQDAQGHAFTKLYQPPQR